MYVILSRYSNGSPWLVKSEPVDTEEAARAECAKLAKYDLTHSQYRIASIGDEADWIDPDPVELVVQCLACGMEASEGTRIIHKDWCPEAKKGVL